MSHTSLTALLSPSLTSPRPVLTPARVPTPLRTIDNLRPTTASTRDRRISPFAHALSESVRAGDSSREGEEEGQWEDMGREKSESEDPIMEFSEDEDASDSDDGTLLANTRRSPEGFTRSMPIPSSTTTQRTRYQSTSLPNESTFNSSPRQSRLSTMSSILPSSTTDSPSWSRRRIQRRRGQRRASLSPGPASLEERRRARGGVIITDTEEETVEPDMVFAELVEAAKGFLSMSPRLTPLLNPSPISESILNPTITTTEEEIWATPLSPLASSAPTIDLSSSGADLSECPPMDSLPISSIDQGKDVGGEVEGWFWWLRRRLSIRVWQATAVATVLIGVGFTAGYATRLSLPLPLPHDFSDM